MSMNANYYVIMGFDLTGWKTSKYKDWKWTAEGETYTCNQRKEYIQLFDDPMDNRHFYLGYILANGDEYDFKTTKINMWELKEQELNILYALKKLVDIGVVHESVFLSKDLKYELIVFEEST